MRYDLAIESPEYVKELAQHHVGGYLKIAPEHVREGPLSKMMKPGVGTYDRFKELFDKYSKEAGKEQYLIPYFIAAHPGTTDEDMLELGDLAEAERFSCRPGAGLPAIADGLATAMYHSGKNPLRRVTRNSENVAVAKGPRQRRLHKAFLRYHDANNWPMLPRGVAAHGRKARLHRQRAEPPDPCLPAARYRPCSGRTSACPGPCTQRVPCARNTRACHVCHRARRVRRHGREARWQASWQEWWHQQGQALNAARAMALGALLVAIGVVIGALGSHALANVLSPRQLVSLGTAVDYQLFNALGLLVVGLLMRTLPAAQLRLVAWALLLGILCFSSGSAAL